MKKLYNVIVAAAIFTQMAPVVSFADDTVVVDYGTRVEMENYFPKSDGTAGYSFDENEGFSGGRAGRAQSNLAEEYETEPVVFEVNETGMYNIRMKVCAYVGDRSTYGLQQLYYTSPFKIQIDDGDALPLSKYSGTIVHESIEALNNVWYSTIKLSAPVEFTEGETHSIKFITDGKGTNASSRFLAIDYIDFIAQSDDTYFKGEEYLPKTTANSEFTDGEAGWIDSIKYDVSYDLSFYVPEAEDYKIRMIAAGEFSSQWYSPILISIDGSEPVEITSANSAIKGYTVANWAEVVINGTHHYDAGYHTITLTTDGPGNNQITNGSEVRAMGLDYLTLESPDVVLKVEGENVMAKKAANENCSGGYYGEYNKEGTQDAEENWTSYPVSAACSFYVGEAGYYDVQLIVGGQIKPNDQAAFLSPITMRVGDDDTNGFVLKSAGENKTVTELEWAGANNQFGKYSVDQLQYFNKGYVTIYVEALTPAVFQSKKNVVMWLDYVELVPYTIPDSASLEVNDVVELNGFETAVLKDGDGNVISDSTADVITFSSSDTDILDVDANGNVYAVGLGDANITACIKIISRIDGSEINLTTAPVNVKVMNTNGLYVDSYERNGENISVTYKATEAIEEGATIVIAAYSEGRSIKIYAAKTVSSISADDSIAFDTTLAGVSSSDTVCSFIWDGLNSMKPLYGKSIIK